MFHPLKTAVISLAALALVGCAGQPRHEEEPHHYSKDKYGDRIACYATDVVNEYDCVPLYRRYPYAYDAYYDPFWPHVSLGFYYGWPYYYGRAWHPVPYPYRHPHHWRHRHHR